MRKSLKCAQIGAHIPYILACHRQTDADPVSDPVSDPAYFFDADPDPDF
jgi:hypothetical protein